MNGEPMTTFQLIEIGNILDIPYGVTVKGYSGTLDDARKQFAVKYGYPCKVAYKLGDDWLLAVTPEFEVEVKK